MRPSKNAETILFGILFLFFLQVLSDFIEAIYAFGLLVTAFTIQIASMILLFTPLLFLVFRRSPSKPFLFGISVLAILARLVEPILDLSGKLVACGISVGAFMLLWPAMLHHRAKIEGQSVGNGLILAVSLSILFRSANSGLDLSESGAFQGISWLLAIIAAALLWRTDSLSSQTAATTTSASAKRISGLSIGLASVILMIYFAFASPTVISRWTGYSYLAIVTMLVITFIIFGWLLNLGHLTAWLTRRAILGWNLLFILSLTLTILPHQIAFPSSSDAYPLDASSASSMGALLLFLMLLLSPIILLDFMLFARQISLEKPSLPQLGGSFAVAALFFLVMVFFHVFTTIYDYAPVIGPLFRDRFWFVYLLAGLGMGFPILLIRQETFQLQRSESNSAFTPFVHGIIGLLSVTAVFFTTAQPAPAPNRTQLKVMTYNIQEGFDKNGNKNLHGQLAVIRSVNPDILGVEESDTARVANGNVDAVRYFADHLNMYSYYGPTTTTGTFGIALLSKYPIQNPKTFFMYSTGEQTAAIQAQISAGAKTYQIFVTHLGNGGPMIQLENILTRIDTINNVITVGDFNFDPTAEQYLRMTRSLADSWLLKWPGGKEIPGLRADDRIDHIFVSPGIKVLDSEYVVNPASDHPYMYTVLRP